MAASTDYLASLKQLATAAAQAQKDLYDQQMARATGGKVAVGAGGKKTFTGPAEGEYQGTLDVAYQKGQKNLLGSMESRGMLRSGQRATEEQDLTNAYQQSIIDLFNEIAGKKSGVDAQLARDIADYTAKYGTGTEPTAPALPATPTPTGGDTTAPGTDAANWPSGSLFEGWVTDKGTTAQPAAEMALGQPSTKAAIQPVATPKPKPKPKPASLPKPPTAPTTPKPAVVSRPTKAKMF